MKHGKLTKVLAVVLALTFFFSATGVSASAAVEPGSNPLENIASGGIAQVPGRILVSFIDTLLRIVLDFFSNLFGDGAGFKPDTEPYVNENFYDGIGTEFKTSADDNAKWNLGYSSTSLVPADVTNGEYFLGGYIDINNLFTNVVEDVVDDMRARCIAINDGTGSGTVLFATVDCIGITNGDICDIRELLKDFAEENNIVSINVESTHCHSGIDTEGLWTKNLYKIAVNAVNSGLETGNDLVQGTNPEFMAFLKEKVANALKEAYANLTPGTLTYSEKDIGDEYFNNKNRPSATALMTDLSRFIFTPDDASLKPTMIVNIAAHPDVAGLPTGDENTGRKISGDYIYYLDEYLGKAGYNCMFLQGAIAGIYMSRGASNDNVDLPERWMQSRRYGYEIARMALALNLTIDEIQADPLLNVADEIATYGQEDGYSIWYEGWTPVEEVVVEPYLNLAQRQVEIPISNDLIQAAGKLNLANYDVITHTDANGAKTYTIFSEVGYIEFGSAFKAVLLPGEVCQDLIVGGDSLYAETSQSGTEFPYPVVYQIFGEGTKCFGLMNDAVGYIVPDNDFTMGDPVNHYHELISLGQYVGSSCMIALAELNATITR